MRAWFPLLVFAASAWAGETASSVTDRGRGLARILDIALAGDGAPLLIVDPTRSLRNAAFDREFEVALARHPDARPSVAILGASGKPVETAEAAALLRDALAKPDKQVRNVYAEVRRLAPALAKSSKERREILLITLENGDAEDDLEATVATLRRLDIQLSVVAREAFLSDSYWVSGVAPATKPPKGTTMNGADGAFVDVPWGWIFQRTRVTESAPSGHAMYGLSRLAAATGGRVFLFYPVTGGHKCSLLGGCHFCSDDHLPAHESFRPQRLEAIAPSVEARKKVLREAAADPYFRAVLRAWGDASKAGLLHSRPSVKLSGGTLVEEKRKLGGGPSWTGTSWRRFAAQAVKLAGKAHAIANALRTDLQRANKAGGSDRYRAVAELTYMMLRVTRVNLLYCSAYCKEVAPVQLGRARKELSPPELPVLPEGHRLTGLGFWDMSLCHGIAPFHRLRLPGGETLKRELVDLETDYREFLRRNAHTPFGIAFARSGIARFHPTGIGKRIPPAPRDISGTESDSTSTRPDRTGGSSGGDTGPTSGGG